MMVLTKRYAIATIVPLLGRTVTGQPAIPAICPAHAPAALTIMGRGQVALVARAPVAHGGSGDFAACHRQADDLVVGEHRAALGLDGRAERCQHVEGIRRGIGHAEGTGDGRVEGRLFLEHLRNADLRGLDVAFVARFQPLVRVSRVIVGGGDEEAAGVLDGVRHDLRRRMRFSSMHSRADSGSRTA